MAFEIDPDPRHDFEILDVSGLSDREVRRLWRDIKGIVDDELDGCLSVEFTRAETILRDRIWGQKNLRSYVDCLNVQA